MAAITVIFYVVSAIQFWISDYFIQDLGVEATLVYSTFSIISITGPVFGVITGGIISSTCFQGFNDPKSLKLTCVVACLTVATGAPIPFIKDFRIVCALLWFLLFAGGFIHPSMTGVMLGQVKMTENTVCNSVANISYNALGYPPAPFLYGFVYDWGGTKNAKAAMSCIMFSPAVAVLFLYLGSFHILKNDLLPKA